MGFLWVLLDSKKFLSNPSVHTCLHLYFLHNLVRHNGLMSVLVLFNFHLRHYFNDHVCPSIWRWHHVPLPNFQFLPLHHKTSLIKVDWYVLRAKNMHFWSPSDPWGPWNEEKLSKIHYDIRGGEAKLRMLKLASVFHHLPSVSPKQLCASARLLIY